MDLETVYKLLGHICSADKILKVFQFGSRVWGSASSNSDWDFFVVIEGYKGKVHPDLNNKLSGFEVDISAYSEEEWKRLLQTHDLLAIICELLPAEFIWKYNRSVDFVLSLKKLVRAVAKETNKTWSMAHVHWQQNNDKRTSLKNFVHGLRYLCFGIQLATNNQLTDLQAANAWQEEALRRSQESLTLLDHDAFYKPIYDQYTEIFKNKVEMAIRAEMEFEAELNKFEEDPWNSLIRYLNAKNLHSLKRHFCIEHRLIEEKSISGPVYALYSDEEDSPPNHKITAACNSTLVQLVEESNWKLIATPCKFKSPLTLDSAEIDNCLSAPLIGFEWPTCSYHLLLYYNQSWKLHIINQPQVPGNVIELEVPSLLIEEMNLRGWKYPSNLNLSISLLFDPTSRMISPMFLFDIFNRTEILDFQETIQSLGWKTAEISFPDVFSLKSHIASLESYPMKYSGLIYFSLLESILIRSRSFLSMKSMFKSFTSDSQESRPAPSQVSFKALSIAIFDLSPIDKKFFMDFAESELESSIFEQFQSSLQTTKETLDSVLWFWNLVSHFSNDPKSFAQQMKKLKFWSPIIAIMQSIRQHTSKNPILYIKSSNTKTLQHWSTVLSSAGIDNLKRSIQESFQKEISQST